MSITSSLKYIESWLNLRGASSFDLPSAVNDQEWKKVESAFPVEIPSGIAELYSLHDGLPDWLYFFNTWTMISVDEVIKVKNLYTEVFSGGKSQEDWSQSWFPFFSDGAGDYLFVNLSNGKVFKFIHEGGYSTFVADGIEGLFEVMEDDFRNGYYTFDDYEIEYKGSKIIE